MTEHSPIVLEMAGTAAEVREQRSAVLAWARAHAIGHRVAASREAAESLWAVRRKCSGAMFELGDAKLNEDVVVPRGKLGALFRLTASLQARHRLPLACFGHAGDGNIHVNLLLTPGDDAERQRAKEAETFLFTRVVALEGSISGEHGIGFAKAPYLAMELSVPTIDTMKRSSRERRPTIVRKRSTTSRSGPRGRSAGARR